MKSLSPKPLSNHSGFTLIEILITVSILSVLIAITVSIFNQVFKNSRDQQRFNDLNIIKQALEMYRRDKTSYPDSLESLIPDYLESVPDDPLPQRIYQYKKSSSSYLICAKKEGSVIEDLAKCVDSGLDCGETEEINGCDIGVISP